MKEDTIIDELRSSNLGSDNSKHKVAVTRWLCSNMMLPKSDALMLELFESDPTRPSQGKERVMECLDRFVAETETDRKVTQRKGFIRTLLWTIGAAAAVVITASVVWFAKFNPEPVEWSIARTQSSESKSIALPDGSIIWLNGESELIYPNRFDGDYRKVFASGEIYAEIAKNPEIPFLVDAHNVEVRVYGTKFNMKAFPSDNNIEVALVEGSVSMSVAESNSEYKLLPGEIVRFNRTDHSFETYHFEPYNYATWKDNGNLYFINMPLDDIVVELERKFNTRIIIQNQSLGQMRYYASFINNESLEQILSALNGKNLMKIESNNEVVFISSRRNNRNNTN